MSAEAYDRAVEQDLVRRPPKLLCAWHPKFFKRELVMREGPEPASHGICEDCREKFNEEVVTA